MKSKVLGSALVVTLATFVSFGSGSAFAQELVVGESAEYEFEFEGRWVPPASVPGNAHFTQIVGATHNSAGSLYTVGQQASRGVERVAELGLIGNLVAEINAGIAEGNVDTTILGTDTFISPTEVDTFSFSVNASHSRLTFLTMLAPSPDWFVGVNDLDLLDADGQWRDQIVVDLVSYDAGTETGTGFSLNNPATTPQGVITDLDTAEPNGALFGVGSLAKLTLTRVASLLGDINLDNAVNFDDISPFIVLLSTGTFQPEADMDQNGSVDFSDISAFITVLSNP